jgi:hypothetical protein
LGKVPCRQRAACGYREARPLIFFGSNIRDRGSGISATFAGLIPEAAEDRLRGVVIEITIQNRRMRMSQFRNGAYAVIAAAVLSSSLISVALAKCGNQAAAIFDRAATQSTRSMPAPAKAIAVPQTIPAFPEGSFDYHGANGG